MKNIIFISDTHCNFDAIKKLEPIMDSCDFVFFGGDHYDDINDYTEKNSKKVIRVYGNCDGGGEELFFEIENVKILLVHGDRYKVKLSLLRLKLRAKELGANLVCFGHTHRAILLEDEGIVYLNPGSLKKNIDKSYALINLDDGKINAKIIKIK